jgi:hypothetical protein
MATTIRDNEFLPAVRISHPHTEPYWTFWGRWKENVANFWATSAITRVLCCVDPGVHLDMQLRREQHSAVRRSMMYSLDYHGSESIIAATVADLKEGGHNMLQDEVEPTVPTPPIANLGPTSTVLTVYDPTTHFPWRQPPLPTRQRSSRRGLRPLQFVPRFAASVVIELRSRLGQLPSSISGNQLIVEREALRLMRKYSVREVDAVAHLPSIISCYFNEDVHYRVETSHRRMSRFQRWLLDLNDPQPMFTPLT